MYVEGALFVPTPSLIGSIKERIFDFDQSQSAGSCHGVRVKSLGPFDVESTVDHFDIDSIKYFVPVVS